MNIEKNDMTPGSPYEWYELGVSLRRKELFGEAVNAFRKAEETASELIGILSSEKCESVSRNDLSPKGRTDGSSGEACQPENAEGFSVEELRTLKNRAVASIELILRIRGFVNKDLMNP